MNGLSRLAALLASAVSAGLAWLMIACVRGYQLLISPLIGPRCRFTPTCSEYFVLAVRKHGPLRGAWRGGLRILRCHPWGGSGHDPP